MSDPVMERIRRECVATPTVEELEAEIERLQAVVDAARDFVNNHMDHDDAMRIFDALAALEDK